MEYPLTRNPNKHYYTSRNNSISCIVMHVTAGLQDLDLEGPDNSAEGTVKYGQNVERAASWHSIVDSDTIIPCLPDTFTAFHCKGLNSRGLGLEISNQDAKWSNKPARWIEKTLRNAAVVCREWEDKYNIPQRLITLAQANAGVKGYIYHSTADPTRRQDPGKDFPINTLWRYVNELRNPVATTPVDEEIDVLYKLVVDDTDNYLWDGYHDPLWIRTTEQLQLINTTPHVKEHKISRRGLRVIQENGFFSRIENERERNPIGDAVWLHERGQAVYSDNSVQSRALEALMTLVAEQNGLSVGDVQRVVSEEIQKGLKVDVNVRAAEQG